MSKGITIEELKEISLSRFEEFKKDYPKTMNESIDKINIALKEAAKKGLSKTKDIIIDVNNRVFLDLTLTYFKSLGYKSKVSIDFWREKDSFIYKVVLSWD